MTSKQPTPQAEIAAISLLNMGHAARHSGIEIKPAFIPQEPYPSTVDECIDADYEYPEGVEEVAKLFAKAQPWRGTLQRRKRIFAAFTETIANMYGLKSPQFDTAFTAEDHTPGSSGTSTYNCATHKITMRGKLSVLTMMHELGHALGYGEIGACKFSLNMFKRTFPKTFEKRTAAGHTLL